MSELYLIRHGQATFFEENYDKLSELGVRQSHELANFLLETDTRFSAVYAGGLQRQQHTAMIVRGVFEGAGKPLPELIIDPRFDELDAESITADLGAELAREVPQVAAWQAEAGHSKKAFQKLLRASFQYWLERGDALHGMESWPAFKGRVKAALESIKARAGKGSRIAVFTSGGVIAAAMAAALGASDKLVYSFFEPVVNVSITRFLFNREHYSPLSFNEHGFLRLVDRELVTFR